MATSSGNGQQRPFIPLGNPPRPMPILRGIGAPDYDNTLSCIRCGLCLSVCPTYNVERQEVQSPRGRVALIRAVDEARLPLESPGFREHMYHCLDCRACQTICPSGVRVGELVLSGREQAERAHSATFVEWLIRLVSLRLVLVSADRLAMFTPMLRLYQKSGLQRLVRWTGVLRRLPGGFDVLARMDELLLPEIPARPLHAELAEVTPARGERRYRVGFFLGCMMSALLAETSRATVRVLTENGCEVVTPAKQMCCGAPHVEEGDGQSQRRFARQNVALFEQYDLDYIVTDCAACGAETKAYGRLLSHDPRFAERAKAFSALVRDISELLAEIGVKQPGELQGKVTYHEPCHLCHAQGIRRQPREVVTSIPGVELVELSESDWCCGSAGVYNITHPERADAILDRKMARIAETEADVVLTGNPGCLLQLKAGVKRSGLKMRVAHPVELLAEAYGSQTKDPKETSDD